MNSHDPAPAVPAGLEANAVSLRHVLGEGFTSNGPLASAAVAFTATAAFGLGALTLAFALAAVVALTWINTPFQFSRKIASAGGLYAFLRESVGPRVGVRRLGGLLPLLRTDRPGQRAGRGQPAGVRGGPGRDRPARRGPGWSWCP